jgi:hypothetical protein
MSFNAQRQGASVAPPQPDTQGMLVITSAPDTVRGLIGTSLVDAGELSVAGTYECMIMTDGWMVATAAVRASAVTGTVPATFITRWADGTTRDTVGGSNLVANTAQVLDLTDLNGQRRAYLTIVIGGGEAVTFNRAEFNGL